MSLKVLYPTESDVYRGPLRLDIVAVHGLGGNSVKTWTSTETNAFWLKDFLPRDLEDARILTYSYNSDPALGNTTAGLTDQARNLLNCLIDKREEDDESHRPIIFVAHSLGGLVVKQALLLASIESQHSGVNNYQADNTLHYGNICKCTIAIAFFGTPHRGSNAAKYGKVLERVAKSVMGTATSSFLKDLRSNSDALMQLNSQFRLLLPNYQIFSFYEQKPMSRFTSPIVKRHSGLLDVSEEDQIPVDANHREICKFASREDTTYNMLVKRLQRALRTRRGGHTDLNQGPGTNASRLPALYRDVPHQASSVFTGREDVLRDLYDKCVPSRSSDAITKQRRYVLHGLGGSGKTQICLKFVRDHGEKFSRVIWVDMSNIETAKQGFTRLALAHGLEPDTEAVKRWLAQTEEAWLLILDNADDPNMNVARYFPPSDKGTILVTSRNPDVRILATVGTVEIQDMLIEDATLLLQRTACLEDPVDPPTKWHLESIARSLGCLALAIVQAGATIRQGCYALSEYCDAFARRRKELMSRKPVHDDSDYRYTVYTTWELSLKAIQEMPTETARNALELLHFLSFLHFDNVSEEILKSAWEHASDRRTRGQDPTYQLRVLGDLNAKDWDPHPAREATVLLSSFSLIGIDRTTRCISMHPLVNAWAKDRLPESERRSWWKKAVSTLAMLIPTDIEALDYRTLQSRLSHIDCCLEPNLGWLATHDNGLDIDEIARRFSIAYEEGGRYHHVAELCGALLGPMRTKYGKGHRATVDLMRILARSYRYLDRSKDALQMDEEAVRVCEDFLGETHPKTLDSRHTLAVNYHNLGRHEEALRLNQDVLNKRRELLGDEHCDTVESMHILADSYVLLGRQQDALETCEEVFRLTVKLHGEEHIDTVDAMSTLAGCYQSLDRDEDAFSLRKKVVAVARKLYGDTSIKTLTSMFDLARCYSDLNQHQDALQQLEKVVEMMQCFLGQMHSTTVEAKYALAHAYRKMEQHEKALSLLADVAETRKKLLGDDNNARPFEAMFCLAQAYYELGQHQEVVELLKGVAKWLVQEPDAESLKTPSSQDDHSLGDEVGRWQTLLQSTKETFKSSREMLQQLRSFPDLETHLPRDFDLDEHQKVLHLVEDLIDGEGGSRGDSVATDCDSCITQFYIYESLLLYCRSFTKLITTRHRGNAPTLE